MTSSIRKVNHDLACGGRNSALVELILEHISLNKQGCRAKFFCSRCWYGSDLSQTDIQNNWPRWNDCS